MQMINNFFEYHKLQRIFDEIMQINQLSFIRRAYFQKLINKINNCPLKIIKQLFIKFFKQTKRNMKKPKFLLRILMILHEILREVDKDEIKIQIQKILQNMYDVIINENHKQKYKIELDKFLINKICLPQIKYLIKSYYHQQKQNHPNSNSLSLRNKQSQQNNHYNNYKNNDNDYNICINYFKIQTKLDFSVFNQIIQITKFNNDLHQMGRYYQHHQYIINLYLQLLKDLQIYLNLIHETIQFITQNFQTLNNSEKQQPLLSSRNNNSNVQQLKNKMGLYIIESERAICKITSFYHNKYLYPYIHKMIILNLTIKISQNLYSKILPKKYFNSNNIFNPIQITSSKQEVDNLETNSTSKTQRQIPNFTKIIQNIHSIKTMF